MLCFPPTRRPAADDDLPPRRHLVIAADLGDLHEIRRILAAAPDDVSGLVAIETDRWMPAPSIAAPEGVAIRWFFHGRAAGPHGSSVVRAADAWLDEWMRADCDEHAEYAIWIGCEGSALAAGFARTIGLELAASAAGAAGTTGVLGEG
ncbi:hypothetical protein ET445_01000 [Agromyces protaetiae]|uniref:SIP-like Rossmann fold domain-containing protein n=1 Tax=Agromyces protaetiae TaxID=2509455 RepID=A0A4V0YGR4_9MICO|nr:SIP domain-containing protein [Agromyces protaetiae]QAY72121.1 hypothetical protein ET445_01000 [Agromyces protaetiae]